jgi:hypothetical protein
MQKEAKLVHITVEQKQKLIGIQEAVSGNGGTVSVSQLIRDSIDLMVAYYHTDIVNRYVPVSLDKIIQKK